jgi:hypothetical protein
MAAADDRKLTGHSVKAVIAQHDELVIRWTS